MNANGRVQLQLCDNCGKGVYDHRELTLIVDGRIYVSVTLCRRCAVPRIEDAERLVQSGQLTPFDG